MKGDCLKLTTYFGERTLAGGGFLADALIELYARHRLQVSLVMRGVEGFGARQHMRTDRLLSLSEDLPLVSVAVDTRERIEPALRELTELAFNGLVTLERARMVSAETAPDASAPWRDSEQTKLTVYLGRRERLNGRAAYEAVVELMRERGIAGATVLLGVDGTAHGVRRRARFFGRNAEVPLMVIAVGESMRIAELVGLLRQILSRPLLTLERATVCKRDGTKLADLPAVPGSDSSGLQVWQKLMLYTDGGADADGLPLHQKLVRELRQAGAAGATSVMGVWGFHGEHQPHGDSLWQLRRRVPVLTIIVDTPERARRWFAIVDELTRTTGLVTSEMVFHLR